MAKNSAELAEAIEAQSEPLKKSIRRMVRDQAEADDVFQDVFEEFIQTYDLGVNIERLGAWLVSVARNKIIDRFRKRKVQKQYEESKRNEPAFASDDIAQSFLRKQIVEALELLPKDQREVFVMHELEGKSFDEISKETGVAVNTLLSRKQYAVLFLRNHLQEVYDEID